MPFFFFFYTTRRVIEPILYVLQNLNALALLRLEIKKQIEQKQEMMVTNVNIILNLI